MTSRMIEGVTTNKEVVGGVIEVAASGGIGEAEETGRNITGTEGGGIENTQKSGTETNTYYSHIHSGHNTVLQTSSCITTQHYSCTWIYGIMDLCVLQYVFFLSLSLVS